MYRALATEAEAAALIASPIPVWLFKHSNACPISTAALAEFTRYLEANPDQPGGMLVVQEQRPLSQWVAERLKYTHQSPQLFLLRNGRVLWNASHWSITMVAMAKAFATPHSSTSRPAVAITAKPS